MGKCYNILTKSAYVSYLMHSIIATVYGEEKRLNELNLCVFFPKKNTITLLKFIQPVLQRKNKSLKRFIWQTPWCLSLLFLFSFLQGRGRGCSFFTSQDILTVWNFSLYLSLGIFFPFTCMIHSLAFFHAPSPPPYFTSEWTKIVKEWAITVNTWWHSGAI